VIGTLAHSALLISVVVVALGVILTPVAIRTGRRDWLQLVYGAVYTNFMLMTIAAGSMVVALVTHDFSVSYVASVGSRTTPLLFTIISLWGASRARSCSGAWVLAMYSAAVVWLHHRRPGNLIPYAAMMLLAVSAFFAILLVGPADPFLPVFPVPLDGPGPNTLLQNHILMAVHPPLLYLGYVGMSVPFAFAMSAIISNEATSNEWAILSRRWMLVSWGFLSAAIIAGMWWSYEVLGWGGYWAWDPVENASFLPWLTATAYLHSVMVQERRNMLRLWTLNLCVATFVLTILGTFLTRSGILSSVHAFTTGPIGYYFLGFITLVLVVTLVLVAGHSDRIRTRGKLGGAASRETVFLLNNLFLTAVMLTVLVGTLYPLVAEAIRGVKVSVGEPFFNRMAVPAMVSLIFLMGVGPALPWGSTTWEDARKRLAPAGVGALILGAIAMVAGARSIYAILAFAFIGYAAVGNLREFWIGMRARHRAHGESWPVALVRLTRGNSRRYGGYVAHIGALLVAMGITASGTFRTEREATLVPGQSMTVSGHTVRLKNVWGREEPQRSVIGATLDVIGKDGSVTGTLEPHMNFYRVSDQPVPTPDVHSSIKGDVYANLMAFENSGKNATVKIIVEPLIPWIWFGGLVVVIGAVIGLAYGGRRTPVPVATREESRVLPPPEPDAEPVMAST
jgi:Cytochrome c biogenesis factor